MLPALLFSLLFVLPAWWLRQTGRPRWAFLPLLIGLVLLVFTCAVQFNIINRTQATFDTDLLLRFLPDETLFANGDLSNPDRALFLASAASTAIFKAYERGYPAAGKVDSVLAFLAERVTDRRSYPAWRRQRNWDREVFFLAHAGAVLAHYELVTGDGDTHGSDLRAIGDHLGRRLQRGRYKHLISRPTEEFFRPADNAAALYALSLYERIAASEQFAPSFRDWTTYLSNELYYAESRLPCAAFSVTDRCQLEPSATATGLYIAYRAAAAPGLSDPIPWREWTHYFRRFSLSPFSVDVRHNMRAGEPTRYCDQGTEPLECRRFERSVGLWAAAEYDGDYTFFRLYAPVVLNRWLSEPADPTTMGSEQRVNYLTRLAIRAAAGWEI